MQNDNYKSTAGISMSMIKDFNSKHIKLFHRMWVVKDMTSEYTDSLRFGDLVDCLSFTPEQFQDRFAIANCKIPSDAVKKIIDVMFLREGDKALNDIDIVQYANESNFYTNWKDDTRKGKILTDGGLYFQFLQAAQGKSVTSLDEYNAAMKCVDALKTSKLSSEYFNKIELKENKYQLELTDTYSIGSQLIPRKGALDILSVDHFNKTFRVVDLKTVWNSAYVQKNIMEYFYDWQLCFYESLVESHRKDLGIEDYTRLDPLLIFIDRELTITPVHFTRTLLMKAKDGDESSLVPARRKGWEKTMEEIQWHFNNDVWIEKEIYEKGHKIVERVDDILYR